LVLGAARVDQSAKVGQILPPFVRMSVLWRTGIYHQNRLVRLMRPVTKLMGQDMSRVRQVVRSEADL
jgi:hypothetical protein